MADKSVPFCETFRVLVERAVFLAAALLVLRTWFFDGFPVGCHVSGGSMAETLLGAHCDVVCGDCGFRFSCEADSQRLDRRAACPNCGYADNPLAGRIRLGGDRVLIVPSAFALRRPRRWEVIAFRRPEAGYPLCVKRVVGLPGESIEIRNGDVFADGRIQRKTLSQQRAMAVLVYDANYPPMDDNDKIPASRGATAGLSSSAVNTAWQASSATPSGKMPAPLDRWRGEGDDTAWTADRGRFTHAAAPKQQAIDWLVYHHVRRLSGQPGGVAASPVTDLCGYDQGRPRREEDVHAVPDLLLRLRLTKADGRGLLLLRANDSREEFVAELDPLRGAVSRPAQRPADPRRRGKMAPAAGRIEDRGLAVRSAVFARHGGHDGRDVPFRSRGGTGSASVGRRGPTGAQGSPTETLAKPVPPTPPDRPLAIGVVGLEAVVEEVQVYRDVYYTSPVWARPGPAVPLGTDEYYVLGDNSAISEDSRTWTRPSGHRRAVFDRQAVGDYFPPAGVRLGELAFSSSESESNALYSLI